MLKSRTQTEFYFVNIFDISLKIDTILSYATLTKNFDTKYIVNLIFQTNFSNKNKNIKIKLIQ